MRPDQRVTAGCPRPSFSNLLLANTLTASSSSTNDSRPQLKPAISIASLCESHNSGHRTSDLAVTRRLPIQMFTPLGSQLVEASAPVVGRKAPLALDPAIQLQPLQSRVKRAFFHSQQVVGQLLYQLSNRIAMEMASHQYFESEHVQCSRQKVGLWFLRSHRLS